jgi:hypothetical protein
MEYDIKYNNELEKYAKKHKLWISNELFRNNGTLYKHFLDKDEVYNGVVVKNGSKIIIETYCKSIIKDDELLMMIKEEMRELKLRSIL